VSIVGVVVAAFVGGVVGGIMASLVPRRFQQPPGNDESALRTVVRKVSDAKEAIERVQQDLNDLSQQFRSFATRERASEPPARVVERGTPHQATYGTRPDPVMRPPSGESPRPFPQVPGPIGDFARSGPAHGGGLGLVRDDGYGGWDAPAVSGPPENAIMVEARDDRIVATSSFPPEAWLQVGPGPAEGQVRLNPVVALNENALRRLSTFFEWQGERPGSTYETIEPAEVRWDSGQRIGTFIKRGSARPR